MSKVLFVATVVKTHIMEFHIPYLRMFKNHGWETAVAARNDYVPPCDCAIPFCDNYFDIPFRRNPIKIQNVFAYFKLKRIINSGNYDIIHCHTPVGAMITRLAAQKARKRGTKVYYTAHGFHFYNGAPIINWLVYYPVEKYLAKKTDVLITINNEDYNRAKSFCSKCVEYIPGVGIDINLFNRNGNDYHNVSNLKNKLGIPQSAIVLLSVGELNKNKNHRVVIESLPMLPNCWYVICGSGPLMDDYRSIANSIGVSDRLIMTGYRTDVENFYKLADLFLFPSFREGLPVSVMEAMATGLPIVCTPIRGSLDLVKEGKNGYFFKPTDSAELVVAVENALANRERISKINMAEAKKYSYENIIKEYKRVYML